MTDAIKMQLRQRYHTLMAERAKTLAKLKPLREKQKLIRDQVHALNEQEKPIVSDIKELQAPLAEIQREMATTVRALGVLDGTPTPSVGYAPDGRDTP